jgi:hypothetical protein
VVIVPIDIPIANRRRYIAFDKRDFKWQLINWHGEVFNLSASPGAADFIGGSTGADLSDTGRQ